jgi:hypothetical protein
VAVRASLVGFVFCALLPCGCDVDTAPVGLRATPEGEGPTVVFDLTARPLPDIPAPNDVATFADPTSRTGRRINASLVALTRMDFAARQQFDELEGWGTFAPITVRFARGAHVPPPQPAIDLDDVRLHMGGGRWDTSDDPAYLVNLATGVPLLLDVGSGDYPLSVIDATRYFPNDPRASEQNLLLDTANEATGACADGLYRPSCDTDFDGVLDRPNTLGTARGIDGVDNLLAWYERETDTLVLQPILPMDEKTEYAVVLTDRLRGPDGLAVRSPFPYVHHPQQTASVAKLQAILSDPARSNYYGDIAGTGLDHVAFAWTFTTEPTQEDMLLLRDGLYGKGPFSRFAGDFPVSSAQVFPTVGKTVAAADEPPGWQGDPTCARLNKTAYVAHWSDAKESLGAVIQFLFPAFTQSQLDSLNASLESVDYLVMGTFDSPYLMGDPQSPDPDLHFSLNYRTGDGDVRHDAVPFLIAVPKTTAQHAPPFPVAYWYHGTGVHKLEMVAHAGIYARQGIALVSLDAPGHGLVLSPGQKIILEALLKGACLGPAASGMEAGRAIDLNGDGQGDSGGLVWSAHLLHTRDGVRQTVVDGMQLTRVLRSFDGKNRSGQDYDGDGDPTNDLAGDFNGDGVVDIGGPQASYFASGGSFGGLVAQVHGAIDPAIVASAPVSGGGGFIPIALRSSLTPEPVLEQVMGPFVVAVPASARPPLASGPQTRCAATQSSVRWVVNDLRVSREIEIACLDPGELAGGRTVVVVNLRSLEKRCARTAADGSFRVSLPASIGDRVDIQVVDSPDAVDAYGSSCNVVPGAPAGRSITTWEQPALSYTAVATDGLTCESSVGCQQFRQSFYPVGSPLVAPQEGLGVERQTPLFRKTMNLAQAAMDPGDPINFAKLYALAPPPDVDGRTMPPRPLVDVHTVGDYLVPTGNGMAFSRASGALPFLPPAAVDTMPDYADWATPEELWEAWSERSPDRVLIDTYEMEGVARFERTPLRPECGINYLTPLTMQCSSPPQNDAQTCSEVLSDADYLGESLQNIAQPHPFPPLRLARVAGMRPGASGELSSVWAPRIQGQPFTADGSWQPGQPLLGMLNAYLKPLGQHDWSIGDTCQAWNGTLYMDNLLVRFFATRGRDLYFLSHPTSHECLATSSCPFLGP